MSGMHRIASLVPPGADEHRYLRTPESLVGEGFQTDLFELKVAAPVHSDLDRAMTTLAFVEAGLRAEDAGYDAVVINAFSDCGLRQLRAAVSIPAVGTGQAAMLAALGLGDRFGILTVWPPRLLPTYENLLDENGVRSHCTGIEFVTSDSELAGFTAEGGFGLTLQAGSDALLDRIEAGAKRMVAAGADTIVLGCVCMVPIFDELQARVDVPVVNPLAAAQTFAELLVRIGAKRGRSAIGGRRRQALEAMVDGVARAGVVVPAEECEGACALVPAAPAEDLVVVG